MSGSPVQQYMLDLEAALSTDRLSAYRPVGGGDIEMVATYFWNAALSQALYPLLGALEVSLRNAVHSTLAEHYGQADWYNLPNMLLRNERDAVSRAKLRLQRARKQQSPGRIIAELSFGFWTSMLSAAYGSSPRGPQLWITPNSPLLSAAFPHAPTSIQPYRGRVHRRFDELRHVRNRVFHHEPIWEGVRLPSGRRGVPGPLVPLTDVHSRIVDAIGWSSPTLQNCVLLFDRFPTVFQDRQQQIVSELRVLLAT